MIFQSSMGKESHKLIGDPLWQQVAQNCIQKQILRYRGHQEIMSYPKMENIPSNLR